MSQTWLLALIPLSIPAVATVIVAWLNRRKIIEVHTLVNGDHAERAAELTGVKDELVVVKAELATALAQLAVILKAQEGEK